jgi:hypothetical protein
MAEELTLELDCKFAIVAVENIRVEIPPTLLLQDGTRVVEAFPFTMDSHWTDWLGTIQFNRLQSCNVFLVRTATSGWPEGQLNVSGDAISLRLQREVGSLFAMLRLIGTIEYENAYILAGFVEKGRSSCTHFGQTERFHITRGCLPWVIREPELRIAVDLYTAYSKLQQAFTDTRFGRGCHALKVALEQYYASDRLHGFVRALEALIFPEPGKTEKQFVSRCALIAGPRTVEVNVRSVLREAYRMRCDIEHIHVWDRSLQSYPTGEREDVALWRTRQMEALACAAYRAILLDNGLQSQFHNDAKIDTLWRKSPDEIRELFGDICDITQLKLVKNYDPLGRAVPSEWPSGWMEDLRRRTQSA